MADITGAIVGIDWLGITFTPEGIGDIHTPKRNQFRDLVIFAASIALGCDPRDWVDTDQGQWGYRQTMIGPGGAKIYSDFPGADHFHIAFPGKACVLISETRMRSWLNFAISHRGKATRIDVKLDDYDYVILPADVLRAIQGPDCVTHARRWNTNQGGTVGSAEITGHTVKLGQPSSRQLLRVYDKGQESNGKILAIRWELQSRKAPAESLMGLMANGVWGEVIHTRLVSFVDFRDANFAKNTVAKVRDRPRLDWYSRLVASALKAPSYPPTAPRTAEDVVAWLDNQVGTSLAVAYKYWGDDISPLYPIIDAGAKRFKPKHLAILAGAG
jgi:hypothetical protein